MTMFQAPAHSAASAAEQEPVPVVAEAAGTRPCPECGGTYKVRHPAQLFCSIGHRDTWNNRSAKRGRVLLPFAQVARLTRDGTRGTARDRALGKRAASDAHRLLQRWRDEDIACGRMSAPDFLHARYRAGFEPS